MSASDHLGPQFDLYHGSEHDMEVGDVVEPGGRKSNYPESWGTSGYAWATEHPSEAMLHAGSRGSVYTVEPVDADLVPDDREPHAWASKSGYRVTGRIPVSDVDKMREHIARFRGRGS